MKVFWTCQFHFCSCEFPMAVEFVVALIISFAKAATFKATHAEIGIRAIFLTIRPSQIIISRAKNRNKGLRLAKQNYSPRMQFGNSRQAEEEPRQRLTYQSLLLNPQQHEIQIYGHHSLTPVLFCICNDHYSCRNGRRARLREVRRLPPGRQ